jgi:thiamine-phosphate pyrophosphorylase
MEAEFNVIVITPEVIAQAEAQRIVRLLDSGAAWRVHIRHPHASADEICGLLDAIPASLHSRISLHDCHELTAKYPNVGAHLNSRNGKFPAVDTIISRSCHSVAEVYDALEYADYVTLSPIFDSISKSGYRSAFNLSDLSLPAGRVYALGGVTPDRFGQLREARFAGAALLGYVWRDSEADFCDAINSIIESKAKLCYNS